jgi:2'-5' RNA ligase
MPAIRAFLAIPLPEVLKTAIGRLQNDLSGQLGNVRWSRTDQLHLTLRFFAALPQEQLEKVRLSMLSVGSQKRAFTMTSQGLGAFPDPRRPRVLWTGLEPADELQGLYSLLAKSFVASGIADDHPRFAPHLTIGRFRDKGPDLRGLLSDYAGQTVGRLPVEKLILYESRLHPSGAEHIPLHSVTLDRASTPD